MRACKFTVARARARNYRREAGIIRVCAINADLRAPVIKRAVARTMITASRRRRGDAIVPPSGKKKHARLSRETWTLAKASPAGQTCVVFGKYLRDLPTARPLESTRSNKFRADASSGVYGLPRNSTPAKSDTTRNTTREFQSVEKKTHTHTRIRARTHRL